MPLAGWHLQPLKENPSSRGTPPQARTTAAKLNRVKGRFDAWTAQRELAGGSVDPVPGREGDVDMDDAKIVECAEQMDEETVLRDKEIPVRLETVRSGSSRCFPC